MIQQTNLYLARYMEPKRGSNDIAVLTKSFRVEWRPHWYAGQEHLPIVIVPRGFGTDGTSIPRFARGLLDRMTGIEASVVHDYLYRTHMASKPFADALFNAMLKENPKVSWMQRNLMVTAVEMFGGPAYDKTETPAVGQEIED